MSVHRLIIGDIECAVLQEGAAAMTLDAVAGRYPNASRGAIKAALGGEAPSGSLNLLYLNSGGTRLLADVGFGDSVPGMGGALRGLGSMGVAPTDIDIVYLTHFHGDHIAGFFNPDGTPVYPNALYVTMQAEWDEWMGRWAASTAESDQQNLARFSALRDRFKLVNGGDEIAPGVSSVDLKGHTLGHSGLLLESAGERLLHVVDILHQPFQLANTNWHFSFDSDPELAVATRKSTLQRCADEEVLTLFYHLPFPGLGTVTVADDTFHWNPGA